MADDRNGDLLGIMHLVRMDDGTVELFVAGVTDFAITELRKLSVQPQPIDYLGLLAVEAAGRVAMRDRGNRVPNLHIVN